MRLLIATHNPHKLLEYAHAFADLPLTLVSLDEAGIGWDVDESGSTLVENARLNAEAYANASGLLTLADDSGLEVDALSGEPGVRSARYAGPGASPEERIALLLRRMAGIPVGSRSARFRCVIALAQRGQPTQLVEGICEGEIIFAPRGHGGFGYDPVFLLPETGKTMAELSIEEKNRLSHRGKAAAAAKVILMSLRC